MSLRNPVKYPVKYYSWQDTQAPQLSNVDGAIKTILKACLVTGYGSKAGAGWTALFEDAYRIVLRRPLRTGNPPDIKIENGTISGSTKRHRIVAQNNPASISDTKELSSVFTMMKDPSCGVEWHCIVTDFAFLLCYQMSEANADISRNNAFFVGSSKKLKDADLDVFLLYKNPKETGNGNGNYGYALLDNEVIYIDARKKTQYLTKNYLTLTAAEKEIDNDFFAQKVLIDKVAELPFFTSVCDQYSDLATSIVSINGRRMLRYVNVQYASYEFKRPLYIPLDYWEL